MTKLKSIIGKYSIYAKTAGTYLTATVVSSVIGVLINPLLAMNLTPEDYASIGYYGAYATLLGPVIGFFMIDYFLKNRFLLKGYELDRLKSTIVKLYLVFSGIITVLCLIGLYIYISYTDVSIPFFPYAILSLLHSYTALLFAFKTAELKIDMQARKFFWLSVINGILNAIIALLFVVLFKWGAVGRMGGLLIVSVGFFCYSLWTYRRLLKIPFDYSRIKSILKYSTPLVLAGMLGFFTHGYDKVLLERQGNIYMLGIYSVALQMSGYINIFAKAIKTTFQPDAYKAMAEKNKRKLAKTIFLNIGLITVLVLLFILLCPIIIHLLTAGRYDESTGLARILSLSVITSTFYYQIAQATYGSGLSHLTLINKIIGAVLSILLFMWMIPNHGAYGAAWGVVISFFLAGVTNLMLLYFNRKKFLK